MFNTKPNGKLEFYDEPERKFINQKHSLKNLTDDCDICVYSLTPKGETSPKWLIVKVTQAGCMDRYLDNNAQIPECYVVMEKMDYEKSSPMNLFGRVRRMTYVLKGKAENEIETSFYERNGLSKNAVNTNDFFSIDVDSESNEPGAEIYLRDKEHFLRQE